MARQPIDETDAEAVVIGAGVIGLAVAAALSKKHSVIVVESHAKFGQETSSRNSEVVHSGIHYPVDSLKSKLCIRGRDLIYAYCEARGIPINRCGKYVVAVDESEVSYLSKLAEHCQKMDVPFERVSDSHLQRKEPKVRVKEAIHFPLTGVVNSHEFMAALEREILENKGIFAYRHAVKEIKKVGSGWSLAGEGFSFTAKKVVNCAGLTGAEISNQALNTTRYEHRFCRGRYFFLSRRFQNAFHSLIYPVPQKDGLGIHVTIDTEGGARLGPDTEWCLERSYDCNWGELGDKFLKASQRYCPEITAEDLSPGFIGIRPKLFLDGSASPDFLIENQDGFTHCLGIESPGLTSSLAIAEQVAFS